MSIASKIDSLLRSDNLPNLLDVALDEGQRGSPQRTRMSPGQSYGRHAGPAPHTARRAAVMVCLFCRAGRWHLPLTERPKTLAHHAGQISLPGGAIEAGEESLEAACRELNEELGYSASHLVVGRLADTYVFASDFLVTPWIIADFDPDIHWTPHEREVESVVELPLDVLFDDRALGSVKIERGPLVFHAPCYHFGLSRIWGATSIILNELADVLRSIAATMD